MLELDQLCLAPLRAAARSVAVLSSFAPSSRSGRQVGSRRGGTQSRCVPANRGRDGPGARRGAGRHVIRRTARRDGACVNVRLPGRSAPGADTGAKAGNAKAAVRNHPSRLRGNRRAAGLLATRERGQATCFAGAASGRQAVCCPRLHELQWRQLIRRAGPPANAVVRRRHAEPSTVQRAGCPLRPG